MESIINGRANSSYNPDKAVAYATNPEYSSPDRNDSWWDKHSRNYNKNYQRFDDYTYYLMGHLSGSDCANFVSQALYAGGIKMDSNWYYEHGGGLKRIGRGAIYVEDSFSSTWVRPIDQFNYFSNPQNDYSYGQVSVENTDEIKVLVSLGIIKEGDPMYAENDDGIHHSMIVTEVDKGSGKINYSAHSNDRINQELTNVIMDGDTYHLIVMTK